MEKINRIVVSKKEEKKIKELNHLFSLMGIDFDAINERLDSMTSTLKSVNADLARISEKIENIETQSAETREENKKFIQQELSNIAVRIKNETERTTQLMGDKLFKGSHINESY